MSLHDKGPFCAAIIGRKNTGKTTLFVDLLISVWFERFDFIVIFSPNIHLQWEIWDRISAKGFIVVPFLTGSVITAVREYQQWKKSQLGRRKTPAHVLIAVDDVGLEARNQWKEDMLTELAMSGRHDITSVVFLAQRIGQIPVGYRGQMDFFFYFGTNSRLEIALLYREFGSGAIEDFRQLIEEKLNSRAHAVLLFQNVTGKRMRITLLP